MLLTVCRGGKKSPSRWCVPVEHDNLTPGPDLAVLGINRTALQGLNIYGKSRKIKGLQARRVLTDSTSLRGSSWGDTAGSIHGLLGPDCLWTVSSDISTCPLVLLPALGSWRAQTQGGVCSCQKDQVWPFFLGLLHVEIAFLPPSHSTAMGCGGSAQGGSWGHDGVAGPS